ncbi:MAG TPA: DUF5654 family protein [Candidatus Woesearchaeota archaeon]|nr:DUF5654 family protein [Candidatus Woesearchaeota archaeon]
MKKRVKKLVEDSALLAAKQFQVEFRKQLVTGITAAFAFLIALSWREPISEAVNHFIESFGINPGAGTIYKFISAIFVTLIAAVALVFLSKWNLKNQTTSDIKEKK